MRYIFMVLKPVWLYKNWYCTEADWKSLIWDHRKVHGHKTEGEEGSFIETKGGWKLRADTKKDNDFTHEQTVNNKK